MKTASGREDRRYTKRLPLLHSLDTTDWHYLGHRGLNLRDVARLFSCHIDTPRGVLEGNPEARNAYWAGRNRVKTDITAEEIERRRAAIEAGWTEEERIKHVHYWPVAQVYGRRCRYCKETTHRTDAETLVMR